jgi:hypothetical protein
MPISALVRTAEDPKLGIIYKMPTSPVTFTSADGPTELFIVDGSTMPDATILDPWALKYHIQDFQLNNPYGVSREYLEIYHVMDMFPQYSYDNVNWRTYDNWGSNPHEDMLGRVESKTGLNTPPQYMRVIGRLYPDTNGDTTATILMGYENYTY